MSFPPVERLIPHRDPMCLIEEIVGERDDAFVCRGRIPAPLSDAGLASPLLGVEMGAQAAAVHAALEQRGDADAPRLGYLVSIRDARFDSPTLPADRALTVRVRRLGGVAPLATYEVSVADETSGPEPLVSATIGTFVVDR